MKNGKLDLAGQNGAHITLNYRSSKAVGYVAAEGRPLHVRCALCARPSGLYESIAIVRGAKIKAGWIVLPDGRQVGSIEPAPIPRCRGDPRAAP